MRKGQMLAGLAAVFLFGCGSTDNRGVTEGPPLVSLNSVAVDIRSPSPVIDPQLTAQPGDAAAQQYILVKFPGPITAEQDRALHEVAAQVYTYLPYYSYLVKMPAGEQSAGALASIGAVWSGPYHPGYKMSRYVASIQGDEPASIDGVASKMVVMLQVYPDADLDQVVGVLKGLGISDIPGWKANSFFSRIRLLLTPAEIVQYRERLVQIPEVFWVDIESRVVLFNDTTIWVGQSGLNGGMATPVFNRGIYGEGQIVGVLDTGIDPDMCYFRDTSAGLPPRNECNGGTVVDMSQRKVIAADFLWTAECASGIDSTEWDTHDHGTHVAGTVAGDNFANPLVHDPGDGMAPGAKLVIQDGGLTTDNCADLPGLGCPVVDLKPIFQQAYDQGARIHTNSWGDQENNFPMNNYTLRCQDVDEFMWNHPDFLLFFAAGNSGPGTATVGSPSTAKSTVSVGATAHGTGAGNMASFSSCGPTDDGRIKPEITIPGSQVISANNDGNTGSYNCNTRSMSGTSMASPGAAGLTALVRQYYTDGWYPSGTANVFDGFTPSAALLRATLINSGETMNNGIIPANCQAWGRILLDNALYFAPEARKLWVDDDAGFNTGSVNEIKSFGFTVSAVATPFKVTLAWTDYPSTPAANPHINNDLDVEVSGPGGTFRGNVFSGGQSTTGGNPDRRNTLEQVFIKNPPAGEYTVTVRSFNVPNGPQPFALVVTGAASQTGSPGAGCTLPEDCLSGFCVDGVCCSSACDAGACDACSTAAGAQSDGTCELLTGTPCDDADGCTQSDTCQAGVCAGNPVVCTASDSCHAAGTCDSATGTCSNPALPDGSACDDADGCTQSDTCQAGVCAGANPVVCAASDSCHDTGTCDPATGTCSDPVKADGATCDDGDGCTQGDTCQAGACTAGTPVACPAPDECHDQGSCDPAAGACSNPAKADGTPCTGGQCVGGVCVPDSMSNSTSSSGSGGSGGGATGSGGSPGSSGPDLEQSGGCGCRTASSPQGGGMSGLGLGLLLALRRRRRARLA